MNCGGCSGAVTRALAKKKDEIESFNVSLDDQIVEVVAGDDDYEKVKEFITKTGKATDDATEEKIQAYVKKQEELKKKQEEEKQEQEQEQEQEPEAAAGEAKQEDAAEPKE
ncbi:Cytosolic copper metallochaperone [Coemansia sp. RSA 1939]|nr:Cytosolic copper metallochaperone [Coemansia sp. RSA 1939]